MFEAGVEYFLDPVQLRTPHVAEVIQPLVQGREPPVDGLLEGHKSPLHRRRALVDGLLHGPKSLINRCKPLVHAYETLLHGSLYSGEPGIYICQKKSDQSGVEQHRNADGEVELLVCHLH